MEEIEFKEKLKRFKTGLGGRLERWLGKYITTKEGGALHWKAVALEAGRGVLAGGLAFLFSRAEGYGSTLPFGMGFLTAVDQKGLFVLVGTLLSHMTREYGGIYFVSCLLIAILRLLVGYLLESGRNRYFREPLSLRLAIGAAGGFVVGIYRIFEGGFQRAQLFEAFFLIAFVPLLAVLYAGVLNEKATTGYRFEAGKLALAYTLILSMTSIHILGVSPEIVLATLLTLSASMTGGAWRGGLVGVVGGFACGSIFSPMLGLLGAVGGAMKKRGTLLAVTAACGCGVAFAMTQYGEAAFFRVIPGILWGGALLLPAARLGLLPRLSLLEGQGSMSAKTGAAVMIGMRREEEVRERLQALSEAMSSLSQVFYALSNRLTTPGAYELRTLCEKAFRKYCDRCSMSGSCWGRDYERTSDVMNKLAAGTVRHGNADTSYIPDDFLSRCPYAVTAVSEVNLGHARLLEQAARQNKTEIFALDYEAIAALLAGASEESAAEYELDSPLTDKVRRAALDMGMGFHSIAVYGKRRKTLLAGGVDLTQVRISSEQIRHAFEEACGVVLTAPEFRVDGDYVTMTATSARVLSCETARASMRKEDEQLNGDSAVVFENREDRLYSLLSDGMGSGRDAAITSRMTCIFLEKLLAAGNRKNTVLKMLNNFIRHKNLECFATVDLLEIDLLSGEASFVKSGAAASYILREGKLFKIASSSLPIGITREITAEEVRFTLRENDLVVMISDGISQSFEDGIWLAGMLSEEIDPKSPLPFLARSILDRAKIKNERSDDMTVAVIRVEKAE